MKFDSSVLKNDEKAIFELRSLYERFGYAQYKMSRFEEYDLYVRNKDFLVSDNIISFTDTNGRLMALKPDVTLSIIKNSSDGTKSIRKLYYNENVYRVSKGSREFKEIMQVGLECIGDVDDYCIYEVLMLAAESLGSISDDFVLDISHLGVVSSIIDSAGISLDGKSGILKCLGEKNVHGIEEICSKEGVSGENICRLVTLYGSPEKVLSNLSDFADDNALVHINQLKRIVAALSECGFGDKIHIDFSVINDMNYYNGFVFKGFINGISAGILSGGQYDNLMHKMGRRAGAIGFAVYLDLLERFSEEQNDFDVDTVILYDENAELKVLNDAVKMLTANGKSVMAQRAVPEKIKYKQLLKLNERGVEIIENNA